MLADPMSMMRFGEIVLGSSSRSVVRSVKERLQSPSSRIELLALPATAFKLSLLSALGHSTALRALQVHDDLEPECFDEVDVVSLLDGFGPLSFPALKTLELSFTTQLSLYARDRSGARVAAALRFLNSIAKPALQHLSIVTLYLHDEVHELIRATRDTLKILHYRHIGSSSPPRLPDLPNVRALCLSAEWATAMLPERHPLLEMVTLMVEDRFVRERGDSALVGTVCNIIRDLRARSGDHAPVCEVLIALHECDFYFPGVLEQMRRAARRFGFRVEKKDFPSPVGRVKQAKDALLHVWF